MHWDLPRPVDPSDTISSRSLPPIQPAREALDSVLSSIEGMETYLLHNVLRCGSDSSDSEEDVVGHEEVLSQHLNLLGEGGREHSSHTIALARHVRHLHNLQLQYIYKLFILCHANIGHLDHKCYDPSLFANRINDVVCKRDGGVKIVPRLKHVFTCLIWGSKPMSNMRSASSSTRNLHPSSPMYPCSITSISRPGVAMSTWHPS